tara:strand:- start:2397 stop:2675 length:279 start_codon:yes stop_codon:yes gene_type:complete
MKMDLHFDATVQKQADGSLLVRPGLAQWRPVEDWHKLSDLMRDNPAALPYRCRHDMVALIEAKLVRGRRYRRKGHWWVEMNSVRKFMETGIE